MLHHFARGHQTGSTALGEAALIAQAALLPAARAIRARGSAPTAGQNSAL
ncbi:hypothetical protein [Streptomyces sp. DSM 15324]|nr:hypothetical protein [Streptomyces sp. DSM 15324]